MCARAFVFAFTFTGLRVGLEDESFGAGAGVGARRVSAQAVVAEQPVHQALVDVWTEARNRLGEKSTRCEGFLFRSNISCIKEGDECIFL